MEWTNLLPQEKYDVCRNEQQGWMKSSQSYLDSQSTEVGTATIRGLMQALEAAGIPAVIFDPQDKLLFRTEAYLTMNDDMRDHLVPGADFLDLCHLALGLRVIDQNTSEEWLEDRYQKFKTPGETYDEKHLNGRWYRVQDHRTEDGYYIGLRHDVTDEHTAVSERKNIEQKFQALAELASDFFWEMDENLRFSSFYGKEPDHANQDAIGLERWENATANDLRDKDKWASHNAQLSAYEPFRDFTFEMSTRPPMWVSVSGDPVFNKSGKFTGYIGTTLDITDQVHNHQRLQESENRYRTLIEGSVQGVIVHAENRPLFANSAAAAMVGYTTGELNALPSLDQLFTETSLSRHRAAGITRMQGLETPDEYETDWVHRDGRIVTIRHMSQKIDWNGKPAIQATIVDVTQQKEAEVAVTESESRLRLIADGLPVNIVYVDQERRYQFVNNAYLAWYNLKASDILGRTVEDVMGTKAYKLVKSRIDAAFEGKHQNFEIEVPFVFAGHKLVQTIYVPHLDDAGNVQGIYGLVIDVTDRKQAEQAARDSEMKFSKMLAIAPDAIIATDGEFNIRIFNKGAERIFGFASAEVIGQSIDILLPERFRGHHAHHMNGFLSEEEDSRMMSERGELYGRRKDGTEFPAEASISKLQVGDETVLTVMLHDISERKVFEAELIAAKEKAEYADRAKSEFLANMSHELRTPLNAIIGFSEMMSKQTFGPLGDQHYAEYSDGIFESGDHLLSLINDILDISKIEAGRVELNESSLDILGVIKDCLLLIGPRAKDSGLKTLNQPNGQLPPLFADERLVKQMLLNLLSNAVKFTPEGGTVTVTCEEIDSGELVLAVTDTGIGIARQDIAKAMLTFGQVDSALDRRYEGTGLGLPLVKSLTELHQGRFEIDSEVGVGTTASIRFPKDRVLKSN